MSMSVDLKFGIRMVVYLLDVSCQDLRAPGTMDVVRTENSYSVSPNNGNSRVISDFSGNRCCFILSFTCIYV